MYWIYDVPGGEHRGGHAFREQSEFIVLGCWCIVICSILNILTFGLLRSITGLGVLIGMVLSLLGIYSGGGNIDNYALLTFFAYIFPI